MYSEQDFDGIRRRIARARAALIAALAALAALFALSLAMRWQAVAMLSAALIAAAAVFGLGFYLIPYRRYLGFLTDMREGLSREMTGTVVSVADTPQLQDGARVLPVRLLLADEQDERIIYLNASKRAQFPEPGTPVRVRLCGRHIREAEALDPDRKEPS